ncbi:MAG: antitoxin [Deltaproteobacteria bacterium]|nr:antitoxin [Deltaproteobacteria bacterium]
MNVKLTLRLDESLINQAKKYARLRGKSISQLVADHFEAISQNVLDNERQIGPITSQLRGCLKGVAIDEKDYKQYLERKHF